MSESTNKPNTPATSTGAKPQTTEEVWASLSKVEDNGERLSQFLEKVGPDAYNEFIHSEAYLSTH